MWQPEAPGDALLAWNEWSADCMERTRDCDETDSDRTNLLGGESVMWCGSGVCRQRRCAGGG